MRFQVGRFICEMSLDDDGRVQMRWFLSNGRKTDQPRYLDAADRPQYRAGRNAFLRYVGKLPARPRTSTLIEGFLPGAVRKAACENALPVRREASPSPVRGYSR